MSGWITTTHFNNFFKEYFTLEMVSPVLLYEKGKSVRVEQEDINSTCPG